MLERVWRKGNTCTLLVGMQIVVAIMENHMEAPKKKENLYHQYPTPGYISRKYKNSNSR